MDVEYAPPPGIFEKFRKYYLALRWLMHPPTVLAAICFVAAATYSIAAAVMAIMLTCGVAFLWLSLLIITFLARRSPVKPTRCIPHFLFAPVLAVIAIAIVSTGIPFKLAFDYSRPAMDQLIADVKSTPAGTPLPTYRKVGFFDASDIQITPRGIHFRSDWGNPFDWCGFAYCTIPPPVEDLPFYDYEHLSGNWYMCMQE